MRLSPAAAVCGLRMRPPKVRGCGARLLAGRLAGRVCRCWPHPRGPRNPFTAAADRFPIRLLQGRMRMGEPTAMRAVLLGAVLGHHLRHGDVDTYNYAVRAVQVSWGPAVSGRIRRAPSRMELNTTAGGLRPLCHQAATCESLAIASGPTE
jgi:hypothetical protein